MSIPMDIQNTIDWLIKIEEPEQARRLALTAAKFSPPNHPAVFDFLAMVHHKTKAYKEALEYAKKTLDLVPDRLEARYNLARCLNSCGQPAQAEKYIRQVIKERPDWLDPQLDCAVYICTQGRYDEAENLLLDIQKKLPAGDPHHDVVKFNLAWHWLRHGRFKEGVDALMIGRKLRTWGASAKNYPKPKIFKGLPLEGKKILLVGEAGAGDEIINVRFAKTIHERGGTVTWVTGHQFDSLFSRVAGVDRVVRQEQAANLDYDYWAPTMDLAALLDLDTETLPRAAYLTPHPDFVKKWRKKIKDTGRLKVGLRWQGNPLYEQDLFRSVPFSLLRDFFKLGGIDFYSVQRDTGMEEILPSDPVVDLSADLSTWEDTAAAISLLDVVVTSCTSIAHLAGALGKKTLLFTPTLSYHIWAPPGSMSIWYPDVKLFRQKVFLDWRPEAQDIREELKRILK